MIETKKLILRRWEYEDLDDFYEYANELRDEKIHWKKTRREIIGIWDFCLVKTTGEMSISRNQP